MSLFFNFDINLPVPIPNVNIVSNKSTTTNFFFENLTLNCKGNEFDCLTLYDKL